MKEGIVLVVDFKYAAELVKGIASGEIVIAIAGVPPIAALEDGDKTAVVEPITITPGEVWQNLVRPAPDCPVVEPTPTPSPIVTPEPTPIPTPIPVESWLDGKYPNKDGGLVDEWITDVFKADPQAAQASWLGAPYKQKISKAWDVCQNGSSFGGNQGFNRRESCIVAAGGIYKAFLRSKPEVLKKAKKAFDGVVGWSKNNLPKPFNDQVEKEISESF